LWMFSEGDYGDLDDYKEGRYILIERVGTTMTETRYSCLPSLKVAPIDPRSVKDKLIDLDKIYAPMTVEELVAILEGREPTEAQRETEERAAEELVSEGQPPGVRTKPSERKAPAGLVAPSEEDFKAPSGRGEAGETGERKPIFSRSEKVEDRLRKLRKPSEIKK